MTRDEIHTLQLSYYLQLKADFYVRNSLCIQDADSLFPLFELKAFFIIILECLKYFS
jgi:hypothetical protein